MKPIVKADGRNMITGRVRLSYCHLLEPAQINGEGEPKYSVSCLVPKTDKETLAAIKGCVDKALEEGKKKNDKFMSGTVKRPLRDGDAKGEDDEYIYGDDDPRRGHYFFNCNAQAKRPPQIVDRDGKTLLTTEDKIYSGCFARVSVSFYPFDQKGSKGCACGLNNVQKVADGESLGGTKVSALEEFEALEPETVDTNAPDYIDPMS